MEPMRIAVLGIGDSLKEFNPIDFEFAIGVNDIWRYVKTKYIVCLDHRRIFNADRISIIDECKPIGFYSHIINWDTRPDFVKIELLPGYPDNFCNLNLKGFHKSFCSPFVACQIAYKYHNATEIHLFGVDMINHPHLDAEICAKIKVHFKNLKTALNQKGCDLIVHGEGILKNI
jgi:hypothetical protein